MYILTQSPQITAEFACGILFQDYHCKFNDSLLNWSVNIDQRSSPITQAKSHIPSSGKKLKIIQISDFHYDPKYKIGANAVCNSDVCCRDDLVSF